MWLAWLLIILFASKALFLCFAGEESINKPLTRNEIVIRAVLNSLLATAVAWILL